MLTILLAFVVACAGTSAIPTPSPVSPSPTPASVTTRPADVEALLPPPLDQRPFGAEDPPTFAEYERAVLATVSCIEQLGFRVVGPFLNSQSENFWAPIPGIPADRSYVYAVADGPSSAGVGLTSDRAADLCAERFLDPVEPFYVASVSEADIQAWYEEFRRCLIDRGYPGADELTGPQLYERDDWPVGCLP